MGDLVVRVRTRKPDVESPDWSAEASAGRRWDVRGHIVSHSDSHGLVYQVLHDDSTVGWYEPRELELVTE